MQGRSAGRKGTPVNAVRKQSARTYANSARAGPFQYPCSGPSAQMICAQRDEPRRGATDSGRRRLPEDAKACLQRASETMSCRKRKGGRLSRSPVSLGRLMIASSPCSAACVGAQKSAMARRGEHAIRKLMSNISKMYVYLYLSAARPRPSSRLIAADSLFMCSNQSKRPIVARLDALRSRT